MNSMIQLSGSANLSFSLQSLTRDFDDEPDSNLFEPQLGGSANLSSSLQGLTRDCDDEPDCGADEPDCGPNSNAFEPLGEAAKSSPLEGTCTVVLHPGDVLEYDPAEYFISEKDFQVKYERTKKSKKSFKSKKSTSLLKSMSNLVSGNAIDKQILTKKSLRTQAGRTCDLEKGQGPLPFLEITCSSSLCPQAFLRQNLLIDSISRDKVGHRLEKRC
jgi:hypothetical protein